MTSKCSVLLSLLRVVFRLEPEGGGGVAHGKEGDKAVE